MKKLFKILTPIIGLATIAISSCSANWDGLVAIPKHLLKISEDGKTLSGLIEPTFALPNYGKLTVPNEIETVKEIDYEEYDEGMKCIIKIDYESGSNWKILEAAGINNLPNLTTIVLPPKLDSIGLHAIHKCLKLTTIDISNVNNLDVLIPSSSEDSWIDECPTSGTLICKSSQETKAKTILSINTNIKDWNIKKI